MAVFRPCLVLVMLFLACAHSDDPQPLINVTAKGVACDPSNSCQFQSDGLFSCYTDQAASQRDYCCFTGCIPKPGTQSPLYCYYGYSFERDYTECQVCGGYPKNLDPQNCAA